MVALLEGRKRRKSDEQEWEWTHVRALAKVLGADLPPLRKRKNKSAPTPADYDRQLRQFKAQGIPIKEVPPK